eukprot:scaffold109473_cov33-Tisochrysis_lutea.AAC.1
MSRVGGVCPRAREDRFPPSRSPGFPEDAFRPKARLSSLLPPPLSVSPLSHCPDTAGGAPSFPRAIPRAPLPCFLPTPPCLLP